MGRNIGTNTVEAIQINLREEDHAHAYKEHPVQIGKEKDGVNEKQTTVVDEVKFTDNLSNAGIGTLLVDEDHKSGL